MEFIIKILKKKRKKKRKRRKLLNRTKSPSITHLKTVLTKTRMMMSKKMENYRKKLKKNRRRRINQNGKN